MSVWWLVAVKPTSMRFGISEHVLGRGLLNFPFVVDRLHRSCFCGVPGFWLCDLMNSVLAGAILGPARGVGSIWHAEAKEW